MAPMTKIATRLLCATLVVLGLAAMAPTKAAAQSMTEKEEKTAGYRFEKRLPGPKHQKSSVLEIMIDENDNYLAATFRAEKASHTVLRVYRLYSWEEVFTIRLNDKRVELYNSCFDIDGDYFYVNTDIYRNKFKKIDMRTQMVEEVSCSATPKGCRQIEPMQYPTDGYTVNKNYYVYRPDKYQNSILVLRDKNIIDGNRAKIPGFLLDEEEEEKADEELEAQMNMADPDQMPDDEKLLAEIERRKQEEAALAAQAARHAPAEPMSYIDLQLNAKTIDDLNRYKYATFVDYEIVINNWLSYTFEFEPGVTKSITISEDDFKTLLSQGSVTKSSLRLVLPAELLQP